VNDGADGDDKEDDKLLVCAGLKVKLICRSATFFRWHLSRLLGDTIISCTRKELPQFVVCFSVSVL